MAVGIRHADHVAPSIRKSWQSLRRQALGVAHLTQFILIPLFTEIIFGDEYKKRSVHTGKKMLPTSYSDKLFELNSKYQTGLLLHIIQGCRNLPQSSFIPRASL
jgi:hypothetical protein